jgi:hypothetical protein
MRLDVTTQGCAVVVDADVVDGEGQLRHRTWTEHAPRV